MKHKLSLKIVSGAMAALMLLGTVPALADEPANTGASNVKTAFSDVASDAWYYDAVSYVSENQLMSGTSATTFAPDRTLTRAMFVTILSRIAHVGADSYYASDFTDVEDGSWCTNGIEWAYNQGIVSGYSDGTFGAQKPVTREQMAAIISRTIAESGVKLADAASVPAAFKDADSVVFYARNGLELMRRTGIIQGDAQGNFNPKANTTRAQAAVIFMRFDNAIDAYSDACAQETTTLASAKDYTVTEYTMLHDLRNDIRYPQLIGFGTTDQQKLWNSTFYQIAQKAVSEIQGSITTTTFKAPQADEKMLSIIENVYFYGDGAAHGFAARVSWNIDPATGKQVRLPDVCDTAAIAKALLSKTGYTIFTSGDQVASSEDVDLADVLSAEILSSGKEEDMKKILDGFDSANAEEITGYSYWESGKLCLVFSVNHAAGDFCTVRFDNNNFLKA